VTTVRHTRKYIIRVRVSPQTPISFLNYQNSMYRIYCTSRGKGLKPLMDGAQTTTVVRSGASLNFLAELALSDIASLPNEGDPAGYCYFVAGLPDITTRLRDFQYEEVVFGPYSPLETCERLESDLTTISIQIKSANWLPIFCPVVPMSLQDWNFTRGNQHKTTYLLHHNYYPDMQYQLEHATVLVNKLITSINSFNSVHTPNIQTQIIKSDNHSYKYRYNRLVDGIHPNPTVVLKWAKLLQKSIEINSSRRLSQLFLNNKLTIKEDSDSER